VLVFLAQVTFGQQTSFIEDTFALHAWQSPLFKPWQFVTHLFLHGSFDHIFFNMFALWMFGSILENLWGPKRFLLFYIVCGLGAALCHMVVLSFEMQHLINDYNALNPSSPDYIEQLRNFIAQYPLNGKLSGNVTIPEYVQLSFTSHRDEATLGASGAIFGCLAAFGYLFPNTYIYLYFFIPIKAKWFVLFYAGYELYATVKSSAGDNVAHVAHLGGALFGFFTGILLE